jgi:hypothetical protein
MRKRYTVASFLISTLLVFNAAVMAQGPQERVDLDMVAKIKEEGLDRSQVMQIVSYLTDVYGPRLTGSPNIKAAAEWAVRKLSEWDLQNAHLEPFGPFGRGWSLDGFTAHVVAPQFISLIAYPKAWSPSTPGTLRGSVVYLDVKAEADLEKFRGTLKGAIVLFAPPRKVEAHFEPPARRQSDEALLRWANAELPTRPPRRPEPTPEQRAAQELERKKWELCYAEGAGVVLEPGRGDGGTIFVQSVYIPSAPDAPRPRPWAKDAATPIPQMVVAVEQYNRLIRTLEKGVPVELEVSITSRFHDDDPMQYNVIAELPGTDLKDEIVMLGAHLDSWHSGTGATDNGVGSAVCLEALRILEALGVKPRRTIRIGLWSGEEQGLLGSRAYVAEHFGKRVDPPRQEQSEAQPTQPKFELKPDHAKLSAYFNLDNGTGKIRGVYLQGNEAVRPIFRAWLAPFRDIGASTLSIANTGGTDHLSFDAIGLPGFQFIQDPIEYNTRTHHSNMDVYDRLQEDDLKQAAVIMASFVYHAAMRDEKLPRKPLPSQPPTQAEPER